MKKTKAKKTGPDEMLPEYDFSGKKGVRGRYYRAYRQGHTVKIHRGNQGVVVQYFTLQDGAVLLEPDVKRYFPDSESVNNALRGLITLTPNRASKKTSARPR